MRFVEREFNECSDILVLVAVSGLHLGNIRLYTSNWKKATSYSSLSKEKRNIARNTIARDLITGEHAKPGWPRTDRRRQSLLVLDRWRQAASTQ